MKRRVQRKIVRRVEIDWSIGSELEQEQQRGDKEVSQEAKSMNTEEVTEKPVSEDETIIVLR